MYLYFPDNYKWSLALALLLASIPSGGAEMGEIHAAGSRLREAAGRDDTDAWYDAWIDVARRTEKLAAQARLDGNVPGGRRAEFRACSYFQIAERLLHPADRRKRAAYLASLAAFDSARETMTPALERVEIPYDNASLPGYLILPPRAAGTRVPLVVFFDGLDVNKEQLYAFFGFAFAEHGLGVLIVDGPGSGESLRLRDLTLRYDYDVAASACVDYASTRDEIDRDRVGLLGVSLGGYFATRSAAFEPRFAAVCAWGGVWDYHEVWERRRTIAVDSPVSADHAHIVAMLGARDFDDALLRLERFRVDAIAPRIRTPFFILHGADDRQIPFGDAQRLFDALGSADKRLVILDEENGGNQHAQIDNMQMAHLHILPWFARTLGVATNVPAAVGTSR